MLLDMPLPSLDMEGSGKWEKRAYCLGNCEAVGIHWTEGSLLAGQATARKRCARVGANGEWRILCISSRPRLLADRTNPTGRETAWTCMLRGGGGRIEWAMQRRW